MTYETGTCKHGKFSLLTGCPECIAERRQAEATTRAPADHIIKVRYYSETTGELSARDYTYYSVNPLKLGDIVKVPVRDTFGKGKVSAVDVPEAEIAAFKARVKTIPTGSIILPTATFTMEANASPETRAAMQEVAERAAGMLKGDAGSYASSEWPTDPGAFSDKDKAGIQAELERA